MGLVWCLVGKWTLGIPWMPKVHNYLLSKKCRLLYNCHIIPLIWMTCLLGESFWNKLKFFLIVCWHFKVYLNIFQSHLLAIRWWYTNSSKHIQMLKDTHDFFIRKRKQVKVHSTITTHLNFPVADLTAMSTICSL